MLGAGLGMAFGGTVLARARLSNGEERELAAGDGTMLTLTGGITPLWTETVGFGISAEMGWKRDAVTASNGEISLERFPLLLTAHVLVHAEGPSYLMLLAGIQSDFGINLDGGSFFSADYTLKTGLGIVGALGYLHALTPNLTVDGLVRVVRLDYKASDGAGNSSTVAANSIGVILGLRYHFGD